jgi:Cu-Zn family superoxide dismutase
MKRQQETRRSPKQRSTPPFLVSLALIGGIAAVGCHAFDPTAPPPPRHDSNSHAGHGSAGKSDAGTTENVIGSSGDKWVTYDANIDGSNPAAKIAGSAKAWDIGGGKMKMTLSVTGLPPNTTFGSHLHKLDCNTPTMAGGHYQHEPAPNPDGGADGGFTDPRYANTTNEAWFDFQTDGLGSATQTTTVEWIPEADKAKAIVVHAMKTGTGGVAGTKLACLPFSFR